MIIFVVEVSGATGLGGGYQVYYDRQRVILFMLAVHYINLPIVLLCSIEYKQSCKLTFIV